MPISSAPIRTEVLEFISKSSGSQFVIPVYQRNYTWLPKEETNKLLIDFLECLKNGSNHFLGILMYLPIQINFKFSQFQIIDGQQRLTTIFLILIALRELSIERSDPNSDIINDYYLFNRHAVDNKKFRMKPLVSDDNVFQKILVRDFTMIDEQDKETVIYKNYTFIYDYFKKLLVSNSIDNLLNALQRFYIVCIPLIESDNPQQIFESINSTGAPLTSADLIRNFILMNYEDSIQEDLYLNYWKRIEILQPESKKLEEVIRFFLAVKNLSLPNKNQIYTQFKDWWKFENADVKQKLIDIHKYVKYYNIIYSSDNIDPNIRKSIQNYRKTPSQMPAPFLMKVLELFEEKLLTHDQVNSTFKIINAYLIRRWLVDFNTNSITTLFPTLLKNVLDECKDDFTNFIDVLIHFLIVDTIGKKSLMPTDNQVRSALSSNNAYSISCIRAVLESLENHENPAPVDLGSLNIEHVMPQSSNEYWKDVANVSEIEYTQYCNLIGNLTLCASYDNSKMGNSDFESKKRVLKETAHIKLNESILECTEWNIEKIIARTTTLIESILMIYQYYTTDYKIVESKTVEIFLKNDFVNANAIFHSSTNIEVLSGSTFKYNDYKKHKDLLDELIEQGYINLHNQVYTFEKNFEFTSPSTPATLMLGYSVNGWESWKTISGESIELLRNNS